MSQTISFILAFAASGFMSLWSLKFILHAHYQHTRSIQNLWIDEYRTHACGRLISGLANLSALAHQKLKTQPQSQQSIEGAIDLIRTQLVLYYSDHFSHSDTTCYRKDTSTSIAKLYLRDHFHTKPGTPNYSYKLLTKQH